MSPEEQATRLVEQAECAAQLEIKDKELRRALVRQIQQEFATLRAKLERAEGLADRDYVARDKYVADLAATEVKLERAEAERDGVKEDLAIAARQVVLAAKNQSAAEATVAQLREALVELEADYPNRHSKTCAGHNYRISDADQDRDCDGCPPAKARDALAATEEK